MTIGLSGERFRVTYRIACDEQEARAAAGEICLEQTVEFPADLLPHGVIRDQVVGRIESLTMLSPQCCEVEISYASETVGAELSQLLNVMLGNISLKPGIRLERIDLSPRLLQGFKGPRFGREGLRQTLGVRGRPLLCTAIKPMGLSAAELARQVYQLACGGLDIVKDDHGLSDQPFAPYQERVQRCTEAVRQAVCETGLPCIYVPNVTAAPDVMLERAQFAKQAGAGALLVAPGIAGLDAMRRLADDDGLALPILSHPAFQGSYVVSPGAGISHYALFGQIARLAGADAAIYPNYGGRFSFSREECLSIVEGTSVPMGLVRPSFPTPGGGMTLERVPELLQVYGSEAIFLIGGGLHRWGPQLGDGCRAFREMVEKLSSASARP